MNDRSTGCPRVRSKNAGRQKLAELGIKPLALSAAESAAMWGGTAPVRKVRFRQADLQRALRAVKSAGVTIARIEIEPSTGKIIITPRDADSANSGAPLDDWLAKDALTS